MYKHDNSKKSVSDRSVSAIRAAIALCALAALGGGTAHAQGATQLFSPLGAGASTATYDLGNGFQSSPYPVSAGGNTLIFSALATGDPNGVNPLFQTFRNQISPFSGVAALDPNAFPLGTFLLNTYDSKNAFPTGPLEIDFASGVSSFGLYGQSAAQDTYNFSFSVYNGNTLLDTLPFTTAPTANLTGSGQATFVGAQALGTNLITKVVLSSFSTVVVPGGTPYTGNSNDFYVGPTSFNASSPVPESSTAVGFGLGTLLFAGLVLGARKKAASARRFTRKTAE